MKVLIVVVFLALTFILHAQENVFPDRVFRNLLEDIREESDDEEMNMQIVEDLMELNDNPFYINQSSRSDWEKLFFLSAWQIDKVLEFLDANPHISSPFQLQGIPGMDKETIEKIVYFVSFNDSFENKGTQRRTITGKVLSRDMFTAEKAIGYVNDSTVNGYVGDRQHIYSKLELDYGKDFSGGLVIDKDPGEAMMQKGYDVIDFVSCYAMYEGKNILNRVVIGDFSVNFGQGAGIWSGTSMGKSSSTTGVVKKGSGINKYSSSNENQFFRGGAVSLLYKKCSLDVFVSSKCIDSDVTYDSLLGKSYATSFSTTGYHRTETELLKKNNLRQSVFGANFNFGYQNLQSYAGMYFYKLDVDSVGYSQDYKKYAHPYPDARYFWSGIKYGSTVCLAFTEFSFDNENNPAVITGVEISPAKNLSLSFLYRFYHDKYFAPFFGGLSEFSTPNGEQGAFISARFLPVSKLTMYGYMDIFSNKMAKYNIDRPSTGYDFNLELEYACSSKLDLKLKYKEKEKGQNTDGEEEADFYVGDTNLKRIRMESSYLVNKYLELRNRVETAFYKEDGSSSFGFLTYAELGYKMPNGKFTCWLRYTYFETDDYDSRIYAYEHDLLYNFYTPAFQDQGSRVYVSLKWQIANKLNFWFKTDRIWYKDKEEIGSGLQLIEGNAKTNFKMQVQYKF